MAGGGKAARQRGPTGKGMAPVIYEKWFCLSRMKIGLFGGSFDPVHFGHLLVAQAAREEMALQRVFFILAARSPFKPESQPAPAAERLRLLRLALAGDASAEVDDQEIRRGGVSYTIDTARQYRKNFRQAELFYLIGADQAGQLSLWRDAAELASLVEFVIIPRPGENVPRLEAPFRGQALRGFPLGVSSSEIRARCRAGLTINHLTPPAVAEAIKNNRLYLPAKTS
jgi:nicotinate-nucleotide adenylyltransferase